MQKPLYVPVEDLDSLLDDIIAEEEQESTFLDHPEYIEEQDLKLFLIESKGQPAWYLN